MQFVKLFFCATLMLFSVSAQALSSLKGGFEVAPMTTKGMWYINKRGDDYVMMLSPGFFTGAAPDLILYLSKLPAGETTGSGDDGDLYIGPLKSFRGTQQYRLPKNINMKDYTSLVIVCEKYHMLWAAGDLRD